MSPELASRMRFNLVGPGHVGTSLARWLVAAGAELSQVAARDQRAARTLAEELGAQAVDLDRLNNADTDLLLITVSDSAIESIAERLAARPQADIALHVSGAIPADALAPLRAAGCRVGSLHPLRAFPHASDNAGDARGLVLAIDGDPEARLLATELARTLDANPVEISAEQRPLYHLAASLAAGGVVTLLSVAQRLAEQLDLAPEVVEGYFDLASQALQLARAADSPAQAITGPIARGDHQVVLKQLVELERVAPELLEFVATLGQQTRLQRERVTGVEPGGEELAGILAKAQERQSFLDPE